MVRKKGKAVSFDAMVKFFMHNYDIPTKKDVDKIMDRMDRLENLLKSISGNTGKRTGNKNVSGGNSAASRTKTTALDQVLSIIKSLNNGAGIADIQDRTGFGEKKIRNIIYRLSKTGKIKSKSRGLYIAV